MVSYKKYISTKAVLFTFIFVIGLSLRVFRMGYDDLWFDEAQTILKAQSDSLFGPCLYFFIVKHWIPLFEKSEFSIRTLSCIFSFLSLVVIKILGEYLGGRKRAAILTAILALSPFHIWYAQEARKYSLSVLLFILTFLYLLKFLDRNRFSDWFLYTFFFTLGIYTDYYFLLLIFPEFITVLFWIPGDRKIFFKWFLSKMVALIMFSPWLSVFFKDVSFVNSTFWPHPANFKTILIMMENFLLGYTSTPIFYHLALLLVSLILLISGVRLFKIREDDFKYLYIVFIFFVVPVAIAYILGQLWNIFFPRVLIIFSIPFYILFSYGIDKCISYKKNIFFVLIGCLVFLNIHSLWNYYNRKMPAPIMYHEGVHLKRPIKPVVNYIRNSFKPGDYIFHANIQTTSLFEFYWEKSEEFSYFFISPHLWFYWRNLVTQYRKGKYPSFNTIIETGEEYKTHFKRAWLILSSWARDGTLDENSEFVQEYMEMKYKKQLKKWFDGILVELYER